jgi:hypothetical protein
MDLRIVKQRDPVRRAHGADICQWDRLTALWTEGCSF